MNRRIGRLLLVMLLAAIWAALPARAQDPADPALSTVEIAVARSALEAADEGALTAARLLTSPLKRPLLDKLIFWTAATSRKAVIGFEEIVAFTDENPDWPGHGGLKRTVERNLEDAGVSDDRRLKWYDRHGTIGAEATIDHVRLLLGAARRGEAMERLRALWREDWLSKETEHAVLKDFPDMLAKEDHVARLDAMLWAHADSAARRQAKRLGGGYQALADARIRLYRDLGGVDAAIRRVPDALQNDSGLLYERAAWRKRRGRLSAVIELLDPPRPNLGNPARWWNVRHWAVREALDRGDISVARRIAAAHGLEGGLGFAQGEWLAGWIALRFLKEPTLALDHFERLYDGVTTPISRARGAYWAGRASAAMGEDGRATAWYRLAAKEGTAFYGQLAFATLIGTSTPQPLPLPEDPPVLAVEKLSFDAKELVRVVRLLAALEEPDRMGPFLLSLEDEASDAAEYRLLADLAAASGRQDLSILISKRAHYKGYFLTSHLFPLPDVGALNRIRGPQDAELAHVLGVIRQESAFRETAVSPAGARGLMQLMPATARRVVKDVGATYSLARLTEDANYNVALGRRYLGQMLERYDGSLILATAAYNAGPGRIDRWLKRYGDPRKAEVDPIDWIETIPFYETRNYVQRVLEGMIVYRHRLGGRQLAFRLPSDLRRGEGALDIDG